MILDAAAEVFLEAGLAGARIREIARRAGITDAFLYRHFPSKDALYEAAVHEPMVEHVARLHQDVEAIIVGEGLTGLDVLERTNEVMLRFMLQAFPYFGVALFTDAGLGKGFYQDAIYPEVSAPIRRLLGGIDGWPPPEVDVDMLVNAMWALNYGVALDAYFRGTHEDLDLRATARRVSRFYVNGIPSFDTARPKRGKRRTRARRASSS